MKTFWGKTFEPMPQRALVTGAAKRVGRAIALRLADEGYDVALHYRGSHAAALALQDEITAKGRKAIVVQGDLAKESDVRALVPKSAEGLQGPLGLMVNNASTFEPDPAPLDRTMWDFHMEPNLRAPFVLAQMLADQVPADTHGAVVNIIDQRAFNLPHDFITYTLSKSGLWTLTRTMALALAPRIRVNGIGPGPVLPSTRQSDESFASQVEGVPLQRSIPPEEIADGVVFLANAKSVTGQMIAMDSGQHLNFAPPQGLSKIVE